MVSYATEIKDRLKSRMQENCTYGSVRGSMTSLHEQKKTGRGVSSCLLDGKELSMVSLVIIFNHRFDKNIKILKTLYNGRFDNITFLVPFYDGDCVIEEAKCYFSVPKDVIEKCRMKYKGEDAYGLILSNKFIMGLHCICEAARAEYAVGMTVTEADAMYMKAMALLNIKEVIFQCLLLDDVKEEDGMIAASLYTIYVLE